jgi:hypothetical protein
MEYVLIVTGVYFICFSFLIFTRNVQSIFVFKILPFFLGAFNIFYALKKLGVI